MKGILKYTVYTAVFATPFVLLWVPADLFFPYITGKNFAWRVLVEIAAAAWVLLALYDARYRPRFSAILAAVAILLGVMFAADLFGQYAPKSFWSNYERMTGWVTLAHFFVYLLVLGSALRSEKVWNWFLNTALIAAVIMSFIALREIAGIGTASNTWRVDASLGNSTYLGVYMLFHIFIASWLFLRAKSAAWRWLYVGLVLLFTFILFYTGTRGTILGLFGGGILTFSYLALLAPKGAMIKKWALGGLLSVVLAASGLWVARDTAWVQSIPMLDRVASISLAEGSIRFTIWQMAFQGFQERPILGWGQENFNYVFNKYYDTSLYNAEAWYDRTHNIFLDWLIAGGILGLLSYLSILFAAFWYIAFRPVYRRWKIGQVDESAFSLHEQALLLGLLAAYTVHNMFVFDNLASWIFYAVVLAIVHHRVAQPNAKLTDLQLNQEVLNKVVMPAVIAVTLVLVYALNYPGYAAAQDIIKAHISAQANDESLVASNVMQHFNNAWNRNGFANQEIAEQQAQLTGRLVRELTLSEEDKEKLISLVEERMNIVIQQKPGDARLHVALGSFYEQVGELDKAMEQFLWAEQYSPTKQSLIEEQGAIFLMAGKVELALEKFRRSYEMDKTNYRVRVRYAAAALLNDDEEKFNELLPAEELAKKQSLWRAFIVDDFVFNVVHRLKRYDLLEMIVEGRVEVAPLDKGNQINLAAVYAEQNKINEAIAVIQKAMEIIPSFAKEGKAIIAGLEAQRSE